MTDSTATALADDGPGSLRQAISDVGPAAGDDRILFRKALRGGAIRRQSSLVVRAQELQTVGFVNGDLIGGVTIYGEDIHDDASDIDRPFGDDVVRGRGGRDRLDGDGGDGRLPGGAGADRIQGGRGRDRMTGGGRRDDFVVRRGDGRDVVMDFQPNRDEVEITRRRRRSRSGRSRSGARMRWWGMASGGTWRSRSRPPRALDAKDFLLGWAGRRALRREVSSGLHRRAVRPRQVRRAVYSGSASQSVSAQASSASR